MRLAETVAWIGWPKEFLGAAVLRTDAIRPDHLVGDPPTGHRGSDGHGFNMDVSLAKGADQWGVIHAARKPSVAKSREAIVDYLTGTRAAVMRNNETYPKQLKTGLEGGLLLAFDPDNTLSDGAARVASDGFFDDHNAPPWDTWITYVGDARAAGSGRQSWTEFDSFLVSWVPPDCVDAVRRGISAIPERCVLEWQDVKCQWSIELRGEDWVSGF
jgi:hypothetical protein